MIKVRVFDEELRVLRQRAADCGKGTSTFMREVALGAVPRARAHGAQRDAIRQLARVGNNLNQLARAANASRRLELSQRLTNVLRQIEEAIRRLA